MTPFGKRLRELRQEKNMTQEQLASVLGVSSAYLSALERGNRGFPSVEILGKICAHFNIIWEDADELQRLAILSHPKAKIDTSNLNNHRATEMTNLLAEKINHLSPEQIEKIIEIIENKS